MTACPCRSSGPGRCSRWESRCATPGADETHARRLEDARGAFAALGAALWEEKAAAELGRIGGRRASGAELTPAEERVAALVADGRTNKQVAAALFLTERTVEFHLTHAYRKLGVRSRAELARRFAG